jgi:hypothetical protein
LVPVAIWNRSPWQGATLAVWMVANPVVFPAPADDRAWSTRAILGEERWLSERPADAALALDALAAVSFAVAIHGARKHQLGLTVTATVATMGTLLVYWARMAKYYESRRTPAE